MKKLLLICITFLFVDQFSNAQTSLTKGDIVITGFNTDGGDQFSFLLMRDIDANTEIRFTDRGWAAGNVFYTASSTEGRLIWTHTSPLTCGTEIVVSVTSTTASTATIGTTTDGLDFATSGDEVLVYQGTDTNPTFITAFKSESTTWENDATNINDSRLPTGLTDGVDAFLLNPEQDNARYLCTVTSGIASGVRSSIYLNSGTTGQNWETHNTTPFSLANCTWSFACPVLSIDDTNNEINIKIHPNPTSSFIIIYGIKNKERYRIYNYLGIEILRGTATSNQNIDVRNFSNGLYFLKFEKGNTLKFIKD